MYIVRLVKNPFKWNSGDLFSICENEETLGIVLEGYKNIKFAEVDDPEEKQYSTGYPNHAFLRMEIYEGKMVSKDDLRAKAPRRA